ncbi:O-antigen ligase family protein [Bacteroides timonensis]|uniref:O-antigen ligase family protein n=1 Tax=Bacteroides timonensis TaxID=1470345 RepID=UPI0004B24A62|nr:O-antigen ligase family protein [Bacteroides timonensis]
MPLSTQLKEIPPRITTYLLLLIGLVVMAYALIFQKLIIFAAVVFLPLGLIIFRYSIQVPRFSFLLYVVFSYYLTAIMRYSRTEGLSVIGDTLLVFIFVTILIHSARHKEKIDFSNAINYVTVGYAVWMLYLLIQFLNPHASFNGEDITATVRGWFLGIPVLYIITSLLLDKPQLLKKALIIVGILTLTAFIKVLYQKYRWFDAAEVEWLMEVGAGTHLLISGIRYFSIFSDAGNFGANMGMVTIVYGIIAFHTPQKWLRWFYFGVMGMGIAGMLFSGTRSAIIIPLGGLMLYCFLGKSIKIVIISALALAVLYSFFTFTTIGDDNPIIRRMRTAFTPQEDASFNTRLKNREDIAIYLSNHPWGAGVGKNVTKATETEKGIVMKNIPPDSFYVNIWIQTGYTGLILYLAIYAVIFLRCCYIIMFRIRNKSLYHMLSALLCGIFGMWLNGYAGEAMGMPPNTVMLASALIFIMNGPYMDKQIESKQSDIKPNKA